MNNPLIRKISATVVAVLLLLYVGYQIYLSQYRGLPTETAMYSTLSDTIDTTGFVIRNEKVITSDHNGVLNYVVDDGEKSAAGGVIAEIYPTEEDAANRNKIDRIDDELARLAVLENPGEVTSSNPKMIGNQISKKITSLLSNIKSGSMSLAKDEKNDLQLLLGQKQIITGAETHEDYAAYIDALRAEKVELLNKSKSSIGTIKAPASGYFVKIVDGYENAINLEDIEKLTVSDVRALQEGEAVAPESSEVLGKVAMDFNWYIVCTVSENDLVRLDQTTNVTIEMPFASVEAVPAEIIQINRDNETGEAALIIRCSYMNSDLAAVRKEPIRININSYSGVLVNEKAIHFADVVSTETDATGNEVEVVHEDVRGVYVKYGSRIRFIQVFSDATINGYAVCKTELSTAEREQLVTNRTIQLYDEVVLEGTDLYDGKII